MTAQAGNHKVGTESISKGGHEMGLGTSIVLIAIGAILDFAVTVNARGFNVHTIGVILMIVGLIGALLSLVSWSSWSRFGDGGPARTRRRVVEDEVV